MISHSQGSILIIDDEITMCFALKDLLELYHYKVDYALNAEEGFEFLQKNLETDLVLLDINLGTGLNGKEALPILKERFKYTQVIMFTSEADLETGVECMKNGAFDYVTKPFDESEFLRKIPAGIEKKRLDQMNELYMGILVHDLKNPVQIIKASFEVLRNYFEGAFTPQHRTVCAMFERGLYQINLFFNNMLHITKFEKGGFKISPATFSVQEEVNSVLSVFVNESDSNPVQISTRFDLPYQYDLVSDKEMFSHIVSNILSNALRFTPYSGIITLDFKEQEQFLKASITNTGSYIEEIARESIFDKFYNIQPASSRLGRQNFGLGLTFCKKAVELLGGKIWVSGSKETMETTFHFTIRNLKDAYYAQ